MVRGYDAIKPPERRKRGEEAFEKRRKARKGGPELAPEAEEALTGQLDSDTAMAQKMGVDSVEAAKEIAALEAGDVEPTIQTALEKLGVSQKEYVDAKKLVAQFDTKIEQVKLKIKELKSGFGFLKNRGELSKLNADIAGWDADMASAESLVGSVEGYVEADELDEGEGSGTTGRRTIERGQARRKKAARDVASTGSGRMAS